MTLMLLVSCGKDNDMQIDLLNDVPPPAQKVYATVYGIIFDESQTAIMDASVSIEGETTMTDENGYFTITGFMDSSGALMQVSKEGFYHGQGLVLPYADKSVQVRMTLIARSSTEVGSADEILFMEDDLSTVSIQASSFVSGTEKYVGQVSAYFYGITPQSENFQDIYPGNLETTAGFERRIIQSFGIIKVELFGENNEALNIDQLATLSIKVPTEVISNAPEFVDMYYRNNTTGLWVKDGEATLIDGRYVAQVDHFTDWCFGLDYEIFDLSGTITRNGQVAGGQTVGLKPVDFINYEARFQTADDGSYLRRIIAGFDWEINVYNQCSSTLYTEIITELTEDMIHDIDVISPEVPFSVQGQINCSGAAADPQNAYVLITGNGLFTVATLDNDGNFNFYLDDCDNQTFNITAIDVINQVQSETINITDSIDDLTLDVCAEVLEGYMQIEIAGLPTRTIPGCVVVIGENNQTLNYNEYIFTSIDTFQDFPNEIVTHLTYTIRIWVKDDPSNFNPPFSPPIAVDVPFAPVIYETIQPFEYELISETADEVLLSFNCEIVLFNEGSYSTVTAVITFLATK